MDNILNYEMYNVAKCNCTNKFFKCFDNNFKNCHYRELIVTYCPYIDILINNKYRKQKNKFKLINNWNTTHMSNVEYYKMLRYLVEWFDESNNYITDNDTYSIIMLSIYYVILNNRQVLDIDYVIYKDFIEEVICKLNNELLLSVNNYKLKHLFNNYFIHTKEQCHIILNQWYIILNNYIKSYKNVENII
jgi:hypothetical protein